MKHIIFFSILATSLWGLHVTLTDSPSYTQGIGYLEDDREKLTAIMESICENGACGYLPEILPPPQKPERV